MNPPIHSEYLIRLSTGEDIEIAEVNMNLLGLSDSLLQALLPIFSICTNLSETEIEEARIGDDRAFKRKMNSQPVGSLARLADPVCSQIRNCGMADAKTCTTKNVNKRIGKFPSCWTTETREFVDFERLRYLEVYNSIVHAWREGRHVVVIT